jgi:hypothetical protein
MTLSRGGQPFPSHTEDVMARARSVEIYLKPGIDEDDQVYEIWSALRARGRPQDTFRRAIRLGLMAMAQANELARAGLEVLDPDLLGAPATVSVPLARGRKARIRPGKPPHISEGSQPTRVSPAVEADPVSKENVPDQRRFFPSSANDGYALKEGAADPVPLAVEADMGTRQHPGGVPKAKVKLGRIM